MNGKSILGLTAAVVLGLAVAAQAETKVTLKGVHLCCGQCEKIVNAEIGKVDGAKAAVDRDAKTISITAEDAATAKKAVGAVAKAGFYGASDNDKIAIPEPKASAEKTSRAVFAGVHNCCPLCAKAIEAATKEVDGVEAVAVKPKGKTFVVEGNFAPADVVKALRKAGFNPRPAKKAAKE